MNQTLKQFLESQDADAATIQHATRYYISERYGDVPPSKMKAKLVQAGAEEASIQGAQKQLEENPALLENACLAFLSLAWEEQGQEQRIRNAFAEAKNKLPVIELAILSVVGMYAMYLVVTGGKKKSVTERKPDGSYKETTEYEPPTGPLGTLVKLVRGGH
jgi:hypothetical protein